ncbi:hypothetical protein TVAG_456520 [Trichomonas vaginalis G3]|uniref:Uncharacterized protein n=1 Tax=Trichomonas vaginalis (strain ATCC PRA-98 / G3) TaxID=412133 RepID=A2DBX6_TRIV3|nr:hypothetical protein TVAGG3_0264310 [Trichomonas vaginalis G3]EAY22017.1 hypothetical protein TVAG_456520 [Trichomonas vaginalis G3]KAI5525358.1 hypothetical protein TVAGG3_0264310 [Trichomonas vaginalis G3]|eukprot:XP_001583003.1 hypothetical protein [Trichomonas vaginalis G3]
MYYDTSPEDFKQRLKRLDFPSNEIILNMRRDLLASINKNNENKQSSIHFSSREVSSSRSIITESTDLDRLQRTIKGLQNQLQLYSADLSSEETKYKYLDDCIINLRSGSGNDKLILKENELISKISQIEMKLANNLKQYNENTARLAAKQLQLEEIKAKKLKIQEQSQQVSKYATPKSSTDNFIQMYKEKSEGLHIGSIDSKDEKMVKQELENLSKIIDMKRAIIRRQSDNQANQNETIQNSINVYQDKLNKAIEFLHVKSFDEIFAEAEKLEQENNTLFSSIFETNEKKKKLQEEANSLETQLEALEEKQDQQQSQINYEDEKMYSEVFKELEDIFNMLGCSWDVSPDEKARVTQYNAIFALNSIETSISNFLDEVKKKPAQH